MRCAVLIKHAESLFTRISFRAACSLFIPGIAGDSGSLLTLPWEISLLIDFLTRSLFLLVPFAGGVAVAMLFVL